MMPIVSTRSITYFALAVMSLLLSGCSSLGVVLGLSDLNEEQRAALVALNSWEVDGKVGYQFEGEAGSAYLFWEQANNEYKVRLSGPFSLGAFEIRGNERLAQITHQKETHITDNPEHLFADIIGWPLPIQSLAYWSKGLPAPGDHEAQYSREGLLERLEQEGWTLGYTQYQSAGGLPLPRKIRASKGGLKLVLLFNRWSI